MCLSFLFFFKSHVEPGNFHHYVGNLTWGGSAVEFALYGKFGNNTTDRNTCMKLSITGIGENWMWSKETMASQWNVDKLDNILDLQMADYAGTVDDDESIVQLKLINPPLSHENVTFIIHLIRSHGSAKDYEVPLTAQDYESDMYLNADPDARDVFTIAQNDVKIQMTIKNWPWSHYTEIPFASRPKEFVEGLDPTDLRLRSPHLSMVIRTSICSGLNVDGLGNLFQLVFLKEAGQQQLPLSQPGVSALDFPSRKGFTASLKLFNNFIWDDEAATAFPVALQGMAVKFSYTHLEDLEGRLDVVIHKDSPNVNVTDGKWELLPFLQGMDVIYGFDFALTFIGSSFGDVFYDPELAMLLEGGEGSENTGDDEGQDGASLSGGAKAGITLAVLFVCTACVITVILIALVVGIVLKKSRETTTF
eukprot:TRINITY_DN1756_c0_g1_i1.p1 TRINITY_DN1756_c0_g1~~TRINITY_DN1756_c0_g1_i1.p1  ORF type:complete len:420 (+),score=70.22 TRINITY_DN1756_c0_g1_i1:40-1299(+)